MSSLLNLVKHYQDNIEKCQEEKNILKCIDALSGLDITVQHLQETGVGRTVNALRKESGKVGLAARSLVNKWKAMVVAEDSDQDGGHQYTTAYNGSSKEPDDIHPQSRSKPDRSEKTSSSQKISQKEHSTQVNGNHSGGKRKYSTEEETVETKKLSISSDDYYKKKPDIKTKRKYSESDSYDSESESDESESYSSEEEVKIKHEIKEEASDKHNSTKQSSHSHHVSQRNDSFSSKQSSHSSHKHSEHYGSQSKERHDYEKSSSKEVSYSSHKLKSEKDNESSTEKKHKSDHKSPNIDKSHKESKHSSKSSSVDKHKSSSSNSHKDETNERDKSTSEKQSSKSDKHKSSKEPESTKKEKQKSTMECETSKHRSKDKTSSGSSKDKHDFSSKEKSKDRDRSSSSKEKSNSHSSSSSEKRHSSSNVKSDRSASKSSSDKSSDHSSDKRSKHKSSSSDSKSSKSNSSKTRDEVPKKKIRFNEEDSEDGIDCGSGASFAEALGMISPTKPKKKYPNGKDTQSPTNTFMNDLSPAALLAPTAKLAPLPALEISALPEISPHYKPRPPPKCLPHFTDEEAISVGISTKNQRTKVYSGNKILGKVPTLYEMCVDILQEHIDALEYTGGVPYEILKPVVDKATPQQLFTLEHYNPYLMEDTDHLWQKFCEKNFRKQQRQELESWREMYLRCQEEQEYKLKSLTANIKIAQEAKKAPIKQTKMAYVDTVVKPPRSIARKQAQHGTAHTSTASPAARVAALASAANVLRPGSVRPPPPTAVTSTPFQKPKKAPLMQKALQFMRGRKR